MSAKETKKETKKAPKKEVAEEPKKAPKAKQINHVSWVFKKYREECIPMLMEQFKYKNIMECPKLDKIVVNTCIKEATSDKKVLDKAASDILNITGQRPLLTKAKKSISNFKLREGQPIGCCTTLRRLKMYEFFNRLVNIALPRVRDFKGVSNKAFDGRGNYTLGMTEHAIFPEIQHDKVEKQMGMNITFVTTANTNEEAKALLKGLGLPFRE